MKKSLQLPDPADTYEYLNSSFRDLHQNSASFDEDDWRLEEVLRNTSQSLDKANPDNWKLELDPYIVLSLGSKRDFSDGKGQARIGANIEVREGSFEMFSSTLVLVRDIRDVDISETTTGGNPNRHHCCFENQADDFHVLERVHWDIDTGKDDSESKPMCHFQVGGNLSQSVFESYEDFHYCSNGLDKPRIPHPPMDPMLVFNILMNQYRSIESFNQERWQKIVSYAEEVLWEPYYESAFGAIEHDEHIIETFQS